MLSNNPSRHFCWASIISKLVKETDIHMWSVLIYILYLILNHSILCIIWQMKRYFRFRQNYPYIYADLLPSKEKTALCANLIYALPFRAKDDSRVVIIEVGKRWNPKEVPLNTFFRGMILLLYFAMGEANTQVCHDFEKCFFLIRDKDGYLYK